LHRLASRWIHAGLVHEMFRQFCPTGEWRWHGTVADGPQA